MSIKTMSAKGQVTFSVTEVQAAVSIARCKLLLPTKPPVCQLIVGVTLPFASCIVNVEM